MIRKKPPSVKITTEGGVFVRMPRAFAAYGLLPCTKIPKSSLPTFFQESRALSPLAFPVRQPLKELRERRDEEAESEIPDGVDEVKEEACGDPREHSAKIEPEQACLHGSVKRAEGKSVQDCEKMGENKGGSFG